MEREAAILVSIKKEYVDRIRRGEKICEYRRVLPKHEPSTLYIYESRGEKAIVGRASVKSILVGKPEEIWLDTESISGISEEGFLKYFTSCSRAVAFQFESVSFFKYKIPLSRIGITRPPQSFVYLSQRQVRLLDRIRAERVNNCSSMHEKDLQNG